MFGLRISDKRTVVELRDEGLRVGEIAGAFVREDLAIALHIIRGKHGGGLCDGGTRAEKRKRGNARRQCTDSSAPSPYVTFRIGRT